MKQVDIHAMIFYTRILIPGTSTAPNRRYQVSDSNCQILRLPLLKLFAEKKIQVSDH